MLALHRPLHPCLRRGALRVRAKVAALCDGGGAAGSDHSRAGRWRAVSGRQPRSSRRSQRAPRRTARTTRRGRRLPPPARGGGVLPRADFRARRRVRNTARVGVRRRRGLTPKRGLGLAADPAQHVVRRTRRARVAHAIAGGSVTGVGFVPRGTAPLVRLPMSTCRSAVLTHGRAPSAGTTGRGSPADLPTHAETTPPPPVAQVPTLGRRERDSRPRGRGRRTPHSGA